MQGPFASLLAEDVSGLLVRHYGVCFLQNPSFGTLQAHLGVGSLEVFGVTYNCHECDLTGYMRPSLDTLAAENSDRYCGLRFIPELREEVVLKAVAVAKTSSRTGTFDRYFHGGDESSFFS